ncbi:MAG: hypothetical protein MZV64_24745 [Ignavibacteriales bacterium]|nr:hypothetical protein [Ignavibacteriales bacterium]
MVFTLSIKMKDGLSADAGTLYSTTNAGSNWNAITITNTSGPEFNPFFRLAQMDGQLEISG